MSLKTVPYRRRAEILRLLHRNGPLSVHDLKVLIDPAMRSKGIALALRRLRKNGYIVRRFDSLPTNVGHFYQLSTAEKYRKDISAITGIDICELDAPQIRDQELIHSQECAIFSETLKRLFPTAQIVRDFQIGKHERSQKVLHLTKERMHLKPDIMMFLPKASTEQELSIAFEIERSRKSDERVIDKLNKMAKETHLDGLVYICCHDSLLDVVKRLYNSYVRDKAHRIAYKSNFLMLMQGNYWHVDEKNLMMNSDGDITSFSDWLTFLKSTERNFRRDHQLDMCSKEPTLESQPSSPA